MRPTAKSLRFVQNGGAVFGMFLALTLVIAQDGDVEEQVAIVAIERSVAETTATVPLAQVTVPPTTAAPTTTVAAGETTTTTTTTTLRPLDPVTFEALDGVDTIRDFTNFVTHGPSRWRRDVPGIEELGLVSTADGEEQPIMWLPPAEADHDQPLLVILHSWSSPYTQHAGIPFAQWAQENGWAVVAPQFRGKNDDANSTGSALAVQDVADAIDFALANEGVDEQRVFVFGYSGGGMMALLIAGQHPEKVSAVSAWGPPHDLIDFYSFARTKGLGYWSDISRACGGDPRQEGDVQDECIARSPMTYMDTIREHEIPVFIGQGNRDPYVMMNAAADVYNALADPLDQLTGDDVEQLRLGRVPGEPADAVTIETYFEDRDSDPVFARESASVLMVYFTGGHDMVYGAAAAWFATDPGNPAASQSALPWQNEG